MSRIAMLAMLCSRDDRKEVCKHKHLLFQHDQVPFWAASKLGLWFLTVCVFTGCIGHPFGERTDVLAVTGDQAESIARQNAYQMGRLVSFRVLPPELIERRYWNVIAEVRAHDYTRRVRSVIPVRRFSRSEAELLVRENAKARFTDAQFTIHRTQLVDGRFWRVTIKWLPESPDDSTYFDVSAKNGEVVELFSLNEKEGHP